MLDKIVNRPLFHLEFVILDFNVKLFLSSIFQIKLFWSMMTRFER